MSDDLTNLLQAARQGKTDAIADLIKAKINVPALTVKVSQVKAGYKTRLESVLVPDKTRSTAFVKGLFADLKLPKATHVDLFGWLHADDFPTWQAAIDIPASEEAEPVEVDAADSSSDATGSETSIDTPAEPGQSRLKLVFGAVGAAAGAVGTAASAAGQMASQGGEMVTGAIAETAQTVGNAATRTGGAVVRTSADALDSLGKTVAYVPEGLGDLLQAINQNSELRSVTKALRVDWLLQILDRVDVTKAEEQVRQLQAQYPDATPGQLARRIMTRKALYVGGTGLASSLLPGFAAAMVAVDLAATTAIQAEMGYQIACAYGFDVHDEDRKGEILTIFALALGSNQVIKTGLTYFARGIPIAGAVVGASTNAVALYAVGHAAAQYYEAKRQSPDNTVAIADLSQDDQVENWIAQQVIIDQILTHVIVAGYPDTDWETLLPQLAALNLSPASIKVIQHEIDHPADLKQLLAQLDDEFALFLLAQCDRLADFDGVVTAEEQQVLETILSELSVRNNDEIPEEATTVARRIRDKFQPAP
ncbi:MAG: EcsC family protein [Nodosilinea sp.]